MVGKGLRLAAEVPIRIRNEIPARKSNTEDVMQDRLTRAERIGAILKQRKETVAVPSHRQLASSPPRC